jgi:hypothetical protein
MRLRVRPIVRAAYTHLALSNDSIDIIAREITHNLEKLPKDIVWEDIALCVGKARNLAIELARKDLTERRIRRYQRRVERIVL